MQSKVENCDDKFTSAMAEIIYDQNDGELMAKRLERWESYRAEMLRHQTELAKFAKDFIGLDAYLDAAKCALNADGIRYVLGRMPTEL